MAYRIKAYTLKEEITENSTRCFIGFKDGQGDYHELEVSSAFYAEFRRLELNNRKLENWDWRHREFSEVWDETLNRQARILPKSVEELMIEAERSELLQQAIASLPEIQRRRFLLHYEYDYKLCEIGRMEHCAASSVGSKLFSNSTLHIILKKHLFLNEYIIYANALFSKYFCQISLETICIIVA